MIDHRAPGVAGGPRPDATAPGPPELDYVQYYKIPRKESAEALRASMS